MGRFQLLTTSFEEGLNSLKNGPVKKLYFLMGADHYLQKYFIDNIYDIVSRNNTVQKVFLMPDDVTGKDIIDRLKIPHKYGVQFSVNNITGFPTETKKLAFDTIELNRHINAENQNIYRLVPFNVTPLRKNDTGEKFPWKQLAKKKIGI